MAVAIERVQADGIRISLDTNLCKGCDICADRCPTGVFEMVGSGTDRYPEATAVEDCTDCNTCELLCPDFALEVEAIDE